MYAIRSYYVAKFYRINGGSTQNRGVVPDLVFPSPVVPEETGESMEDNALPWDSIKPANYKKYGELEPYVRELVQRHQQRIRITSYNVCYTKLLRVEIKETVIFSRWCGWGRVEADPAGEHARKAVHLQRKSLLVKPGADAADVPETA